MSLSTSNNLNIFPTFKTITLDDRDILNKLNENFLPYSDFSTLSLLCWNAEKKNSFSILNDNLVIKIKDYLGEGYIYSFLGKNKINETVDTLLGNFGALSLVPEFIISDLNKSKYEITEDRDSFDYIINTNSFTELKGGIYKSLRRNINIFAKKYPNYHVRELVLSNEGDQKSVLELNHTWGNSKNFGEDKMDEDYTSIQTFINYSKYFNTISLGIFVEEKLVAFTLNELLDNCWSMGHFGKAHKDFDKSSAFMEYATSKELKERGYKYINLQQDTGLSGLREAKTELKPEYFLRKFKVSYKPI